MGGTRSFDECGVWAKLIAIAYDRKTKSIDPRAAFVYFGAGSLKME